MVTMSHATAALLLISAAIGWAATGALIGWQLARFMRKIGR